MDSEEVWTSFTWPGHKEELIKQQRHLFVNNAESDCILISAQGKRISAHQIILSSSSDFFRKMLSELPPSVQPAVIHLPDVNTIVLESILKFIYTGQTNIVSGYLVMRRVPKLSSIITLELNIHCFH